MALVSFLWRLLWVRPIKQEALNNYEGIERMHITNFFAKRKPGISAILRTRDGGAFLEDVVGSFIEYVDELVIVDNLSEKSSSDIIRALAEKFPTKVRIYEYPYEILREDGVEHNSLHSFSYFSNRAIAKASYETVLKVDDDNLFLPERIKKQVAYVKNKRCFSTFSYFYYRGLNFFEKDETVGVVADNPYSGRYGDIGFFKLSKKTYFRQIGDSERLITNCMHIDLGFSYIHLKYFKKDSGLQYAPSRLYTYYKTMLAASPLKKVEQYTPFLTSERAVSLIKKVLTDNL